MKPSELIEIAGRIQAILGRGPKCTVNEMTQRLVEAVGDCETRGEAVRAIAEQVFHHEFSAEYSETDSEILNIA